MAEEQSCLGVVLAGGESRRMGANKAFMTYHRLPQWQHCAELMKEYCGEVLISGRNDKKDQDAYVWIEDAPEFAGSGPISGILTLHHRFPGKDFLVLGCDYPLLRHKELKDLMEWADKSGSVAFASPDDGQPEPLIAYYSSSLLDALQQAWKEGARSLRKQLIAQHIPLINASEPEALMSADTPEKAEIANVLIRAGFTSFE